MTQFTHTAKFNRETKGTWVYEVPLKAGERISGSNTAYLLKSEYLTKPTEEVKITYEF